MKNKRYARLGFNVDIMHAGHHSVSGKRFFIREGARITAEDNDGVKSIKWGDTILTNKSTPKEFGYFVIILGLEKFFG